MSAGLLQVIEFLGTLRFSADKLSWLKASGMFAPSIINSLAEQVG